MASLRTDARSGRFMVVFRYGGRQFQRSLKTKKPREAEAIRGRVEETISLLERGRLVMSPNAEPGALTESSNQRQFYRKYTRCENCS